MIHFSDYIIKWQVTFSRKKHYLFTKAVGLGSKLFFL
jgi:hypothetical protein